MNDGRQVSLGEIQSALQAWAGSENGRVILGWMAWRFGFMTGSTYDAREPVEAAIHREGQRSVLTEINRLIEMPIVEDEDRQPDEGHETYPL